MLGETGQPGSKQGLLGQAGARPGLLSQAWATLTRHGPAALLLATLVALWEFACRWFAIPHFVLPRPSQVAVALWQWREPLVLEHLPVTAAETLLGLGISIILGVALATAMHLSPTAGRAVYPLIVASQTIPIIALSPIFLFWFGYSMAQKVAVVVLVAFFPIAVAARDGLRAADPDLLDWMKASGASRWRVFRMAEAPAALPSFFSGLKVGASVSVIGAVLGEWLGGQSGLGVFGRRAASNLKSPELLASVVLLALLGIGLFLAATLVERVALRYKK
ncbi:MAG TPA: ABC transporter permease [Symbiobacteriaceae bacterium]|nr:ABC transporter permease [Symbiobacteriaceae bacterium]